MHAFSCVFAVRPHKKRSQTATTVNKNGCLRKRSPHGNSWKRRYVALVWKVEPQFQTTLVVSVLQLKTCAQDSKKVQRTPGNANASFDVRFSFPSVDADLCRSFCRFGDTKNGGFRKRNTMDDVRILIHIPFIRWGWYAFSLATKGDVITFHANRVSRIQDNVWYLYKQTKKKNKTSTDHKSYTRKVCDSASRWSVNRTHQRLLQLQ